MARKLPNEPVITYDFSSDVYITNLPKELDKTQILTELGILDNENVKFHRISFDRHLGSCPRVFVRYKTREEADAALNYFGSLTVLENSVVLRVQEYLDSLKNLEISVKKKLEGKKVFTFEHSVLIIYEGEMATDMCKTIFKKFGTIVDITRQNNDGGTRLIKITFAFFSEAIAAQIGLDGFKLGKQEMMVEVMQHPLAVHRQLRILDMLW